MPTFTRLHVRTDQQRRWGPTGRRDGRGGQDEKAETAVGQGARLSNFILPRDFKG